MSLTIADLFGSAGLAPQPPVRWGEPCKEHQPGVYVVEIDGTVVYIGRTRRSLARRISEFYRHRYGDKRPHREGQELLNLPGVRLVYWRATDEPRDAETKMLRTFEDRYGCLPIANRRRGDRKPMNS